MILLMAVFILWTALFTVKDEIVLTGFPEKSISSNVVSAIGLDLDFFKIHHLLSGGLSQH